VLAKFDLARIPADATITKAVLSFYTFKVATSCCAPYGPMGQCTKYLYRITDSWNENTVNAGSTAWDNQPALSQSQSASCTNTKTPAWEEFDVTADVKDMFAKPATNFGFLFRCKETDTDMGITMRSSESSQPTYRPKLTVTYESSGIIHQNILNTFNNILEFKVTVYTMQGREISSGVLKNIRQLETMLPAGVNIVKINGKKMKIIKQK